VLGSLSLGVASLNLSTRKGTNVKNVAQKDKQDKVIPIGKAPLPAPQSPMDVARRLIAAKYLTDDSRRTLCRWQGEWWSWETTCWRKVDDDSLRQTAYRFTESATWVTVKDESKPWAPTRYKIANLLEALGALCTLPTAVQPPTWLKKMKQAPNAAELVSLTNGLLHVPTQTLYAHTPHLFNHVALPFAYDPEAKAPRWLTFLNLIWPNDPASIAALQEWFGYVLSGRIDLHKILLLIGPPRAGKGVIANILQDLVGPLNVADPTLASLGTQFGLWPLIGKPLAIISDARFGGKHDAALVERLLAISGVGSITIDRKNREAWTGTLPTRFFIISNELPRLSDASGAIAGRFVLLHLIASWLGKENPALTDELRTELPGIFNWALDGLERLTQVGRFTKPKSSKDSASALADLVSPVGTFVRDCCVVGADKEVLRTVLYEAWTTWAAANGHHPVLNTAQFGIELRAVIPALKGRHPWVEGKKVRYYVGVALDQGQDPPLDQAKGSVEHGATGVHAATKSLKDCKEYKP
jgi:putative DNA primase/helicase